MAENQFQFVNAGKAAGTTVLNAVMSDFSYANHAHEELALGVTVRGIQEFDCNGSLFRSVPGDIILFNPGDVHNGHPGSGSALHYTMLYIDEREFLALGRSIAGHDRFGLRGLGRHFTDQTLQTLILSMAGLIAMPGVSGLEYEGGLYRLARRMSQVTNAFQPEQWRERKEPLLLRARAYIHDNIGDDISIDDLGRVANMSKYHFIRLFRNQFGLSPHQYILNLRVNRARMALAVGTSPTEVAHCLGFFDVSHLNRMFKRSYGLTPKQYQQQLLK